MRRYCKAVKFDDFIIFSNDLTNEELEKFKNSENEELPTDVIENSIQIENDCFFLKEWQEYGVIGINGKLVDKDFLFNGKLGRNNTGTIMFKNFVGTSRFKNQLFTIESDKMDSEQVDILISYVDERVKQTISMNFSAQGVNRGEFQKLTERYQNYYVYQKLYNALESNRIIPYIDRVQRYPNKQFQKHKREVSISEIQNISEDTIIDFFSGQTSLIKSERYRKTKGYLRIALNEYYNRISIDTNENRFIKFFMSYCIIQISRFIELLESDIDENNSCNILLVEKLHEYRENFQRLLNSHFFKDVSSVSTLNYGSTVLTRQYGYKQIYSEYVNLKQVPINMFNANSLIELFENKSIDKLYEFICLFRLVDILESIYSQKSDETIKFNKKQPLFSVGLSEENGGVEFRFSKTENLPESRILFQHSFTRANLGSYSVEFKPDFSWEIMTDDKKFRYHFDAKFRMSNFSHSKNDDIVKMHSYRDGIEMTVGAFVLFPGENKRIYSVDCENPFSGVGAFPLNINHEHDEEIRNMMLECALKIE